MGFKFKRFCRRFHRNRKYINKAGKSFTEGCKFNMHEFCDYYDTLTDEEWDAAIKMAAKKGYDISNIKPYIRVYGNSFDRFFTPMCFEEVREKLLEMHGCNDIMCDMTDDSLESQRRSVELLYADLGVPIPDYWREKLWR